MWDLAKQHPASPPSTDHSSCTGCAEMLCLPLCVCLAVSRALFGFSEDCFEVTRGAMFHLGIGRAAQSNIFKVSPTARGCSGGGNVLPGWDCCWNKSLALLLLTAGPSAPQQAAQTKIGSEVKVCSSEFSVCLQELQR